MKTQIRRNLKIILTVIMIIMVGVTYAQLKGNGNIKTEDRNTGNFNGIRLSCSADLIISQGSTSVKVKTDENLLKHVATTVEDGVLKIDVKKDRIRFTSAFEVYVTVPNLEVLKNLGSGDIRFKGTYKANELFIVNSGSGDLDAEDLKLEECYVKSAGSGDIDLSGKTNSLTLTVAGSADVSAYNLTAVSASVSNSGSSDITLNIVEKLQARLNGSGDITYRGDPSQVDVRSNGSGEVYKK